MPNTSQKQPKKGRGRPRKDGKAPLIATVIVAKRKEPEKKQLSTKGNPNSSNTGKRGRGRPKKINPPEAQTRKRSSPKNNNGGPPSKKKKKSNQENANSNFPEPRRKIPRTPEEREIMIAKYTSNEFQEQIYGLQETVEKETFCIDCASKKGTELTFMNPTYRYTPILLDNVSTAELNELVEMIKKSFYFEQEVVDPLTNIAEDMYVPLNDLKRNIDKHEFHKMIGKLQYGKEPFKTWYFNKEKNRLKCRQVHREESMTLTKIFKRTDDNDDHDSLRLQTTHFSYQNNPFFHKKGFGNIMKKITDKVLGAAKSIDQDFGAIIGSILVSLPGDENQAFHVDDVRNQKQDDMLSCIVSLSPGSGLNVAKNYNFRGEKKQSYKKLEIHQGSGILFSGTTIHGGCAYPDEMNVRLHCYILKEENGPAWDIFSNDMRQRHIYCKYKCCNYHKPDNANGRQAMDRHEKRCPKRE